MRPEANNQTSVLGSAMSIRLIAAPVLLLVIATVQIVLVNVCGLSPWKGGGFGMFAVSTYRMTTIEGETTDGTLVKIAHRPVGYEHLGWMSNAADYERLAGELIALDYIDTLDESDAFLANVAADDPGAAARLEELLAENAEHRADTDRSIWLRPPDELDGPPAGASIHRLGKLTVRRWRVQFDPATDHLRLVADGEPIVVTADAEVVVASVGDADVSR